MRLRIITLLLCMGVLAGHSVRGSEIKSEIEITEKETEVSPEKLEKRWTQNITTEKNARWDKLNNQLTNQTFYLYKNKNVIAPQSFQISFLTSAARGAEIFWKLLLITNDKKTKNKQLPQPETMNDIVDFVNFVLFAALPSDNEREFSLENIAFKLELDRPLAKTLKTYFESYAARAKKIDPKYPENIFKKSEKIDGWLSIHLREVENQGSRYLWFGPEIKNYKSFGFFFDPNIPDSPDFIIQPHPDQSGHPSNTNPTNTINLSLDDLITAKLLLTQSPGTTMLGAFYDTDTTRLIKNTNTFIKKLKKQNTQENSILSAFFRSLLWQYMLSETKKQGFEFAPINPSDAQIIASLGQYTTRKITDVDIKKFRESVSHGARVAKNVMLETEPQKSPSFRKYFNDIVDLNTFFYALAIFARADGVGPASVAFSIIGPNDDNRFKEYIYGYINKVKENAYDTGTTSDLIGKNPLAYYRTQSHGFTDAWGMDIRPSETDPVLPLLLKDYWKQPKKLAAALGPQYHLLIGLKPAIDKYQPVFIKWEDHGLYDWTALGLHTEGLISSKARKNKALRYMFGMTPDDAPQFNKERVPGLIAEKVVELASKKAPKKILELAKAAAKKSISALYTFIREDKNSEHFTDLIAFIEKNYNHPGLRKGNEIIIAPHLDDSCLWIDYFSADDQKDADVKKFCTAFSIFKRKATALAADVFVTKELTESITEIAKPEITDWEKQINNLETLYTKTVKEKLSPTTQDYLSYMFTSILSPLRKQAKESAEDTTDFLQQYGKILFDKDCASTVASGLLLPLEGSLLIEN